MNLDLHIDPVPAHLHLHFDISTPDPRIDEVLAILTEAHLSDLPGAISGLTAAITDVSNRVNEDVAHLQDLLAQALAADAADQATAARLQAEADAAFQRITDATSSLTSIDPLADFPAAPEPPPQPPVEPTP